MRKNASKSRDGAEASKDIEEDIMGDAKYWTTTHANAQQQDPSTARLFRNNVFV
jgi:hypothetical protein